MSLEAPKNYYGFLYELPFEDDRREKYLKQLEDQGFDDTETWNLDTTVIKFVLPRLKRFKEVDNGYPGNLNSSEEWDEIIDTVIDGFEAYLENWWDDQNKSKFDKAIELFCRYFTNFWW